MRTLTIAGVTLAALLLTGCATSPDGTVQKDAAPVPDTRIGVTVTPDGGVEYEITGLNLGDCFDVTGEGAFGVTKADCTEDATGYQVFYVKALSFDEEEAAAAGEPQLDVDAEHAAAEERLNADVETAVTGRERFSLYEPNADGGVTQISAIALK